ncbi:FAD-dependent monooxygenase [Streptomyces sp. NPDC017405]|uniref:FAD-dependent monooxygenase n=1 Tax=unclassified Streptomyces TaxID=2593676 RepID=UPI0037B62EFD
MTRLEPDVVVAGAGPVGLMLACELRTAGVSVVVLDRLERPDPAIRAGSIGPLAVEALERRGFAKELLAAEQDTLRRYAEMAAAAPHPGDDDATASPKEHFAGLDKIDSSRYEGAGRRRMRVEQPALVEILLRRAEDLGIDVRREHEVVEVRQDSGGVVVTAETPGGRRAVRGRYAVGCDGGGSAVRRLTGFAFTGTPATVTGRRGVVELADPSALTPGFAYGPGGVLVYGLGVNRVATLEFNGPPEDPDRPLTTAELRDSVRRVSGTDVPITAMTAGGYFTDHAYQASAYRMGRVLLAGDAAHVHAPFGGQGLNVGIVDAVNLGWKLAAEVLGHAPPGLLDTYSAERHPVGARLLHNTRAQTALMRPDPHSTALRELFSDLMDLPEVDRFLGRMLAGFDIRYDLGATDPLVGTLLPNLPLAAPGGGPGGSVADAMHAARGLLIDLRGCDEIGEAAAGWAGRVDAVTAPGERTDDLGDVEALLLRPDGCVAWVLRTGSRFDAGRLTAALEQWFGAPLAS